VRSSPQVVRVAGRQVAVEDAGPESGFPVIVHHGGTRHLFPGAVRGAQASGLRLIGYDRPGQGSSTPQPGRVVADCADDVRAILAHLGISRAAVWGSSGGGPYALATAALLPEAVASVCLFASLGPYGQPGLDFAEGMGDDFREQARVFFDEPDRARAGFQAQTAQFARLASSPVWWMDRWGHRAGKDPPTARSGPATWPWSTATGTQTATKAGGKTGAHRSCRGASTWPPSRHRSPYGTGSKTPRPHRPIPAG
jgi:pimeloyl-ACP methyl ester carboxylesterase